MLEPHCRMYNTDSGCKKNLLFIFTQHHLVVTIEISHENDSIEFSHGSDTRQQQQSQSYSGVTFRITSTTYKGSLSFLYGKLMKSTCEIRSSIKQDRKKIRDRATKALRNRKCTGECEEVKEWVSLWWASQALAALQFVAPLTVSGWWDTYIHDIVAWRFIMGWSVCYLLLWYNTIDFC